MYICGGNIRLQSVRCQDYNPFVVCDPSDHPPRWVSRDNVMLGLLERWDGVGRPLKYGGGPLMLNDLWKPLWIFYG